MAEQEQDKSENATPFKLEEAKRRGQVAKSIDFNSFFMIAGLLMILYVWGLGFVREGVRLEQAILEQSASVNFGVYDLIDWFGTVAYEMALLLMPFFLAAMVAAVAANMIQTGPIFTFFPLKPDPQRVNPVQGFKRVFSLRMLFEGVKNMIKLGLFGAIAYMVLSGLMPTLLGLVQVDPKHYVAMLLDESTLLIFKLALVILIVAALDFAYTRWDFGKKMRMSRRELKEEIKRREGDPHIRAKLKELQRELLKRSKSAGRVPEADVLITNPTHYAVALQYRRGAMAAPCVIAKGAGDVARGMKLLAARAGVPVREARELARALFHEVDIDALVPEHYYEPVARILADVYRAEGGGVTVGVSA